jgi:hypothetical protein
MTPSDPDIKAAVIVAIDIKNNLFVFICKWGESVFLLN